VDRDNAWPFTGSSSHIHVVVVGGGRKGLGSLEPGAPIQHIQFMHPHSVVGGDRKGLGRLEPGAPGLNLNLIFGLNWVQIQTEPTESEPGGSVQGPANCQTEPVLWVQVQVKSA